jgi:hypothetical protein
MLGDPWLVTGSYSPCVTAKSNSRLAPAEPGPEAVDFGKVERPVAVAAAHTNGNGQKGRAVTPVQKTLCS